jgi:hypothetical protein
MAITESWTEWRITGTRPNYGPWEGDWKPLPPKRWDIERLIKRNDNVKVECRAIAIIHQREVPIEELQ